MGSDTPVYRHRHWLLQLLLITTHHFLITDIHNAMSISPSSQHLCPGWVSAWLSLPVCLRWAHWLLPCIFQLLSCINLHYGCRSRLCWETLVGHSTPEHMTVYAAWRLVKSWTFNSFWPWPLHTSNSPHSLNPFTVLSTISTRKH